MNYMRIQFIHIRNHYYQRNRKRIVYDPSQHNYGSEAPTMREIRPGHFVLCSEAEYKKYKEIYQ